ncbi:hypothetical protein HYH03_008088 [Edaphochlamys debaryana]|uniref:Cyclic nucleotide-binding domain-containing protein n=1 Tax=Edaphochlamys debaryana TaxID=47281 RepID=A0A836BZN1_9CHLO|nr:hypothetical protein HYH03_008088 [Edaphochlamys debaryana]|eukprot:KAG2493569.1 hypothetical protein HYH03_008088 [Edaphochlamys debaryana]
MDRVALQAVAAAAATGDDTSVQSGRESTVRASPKPPPPDGAKPTTAHGGRRPARISELLEGKADAPSHEDSGGLGFADSEEGGSGHPYRSLYTAEAVEGSAHAGASIYGSAHGSSAHGTAGRGHGSVVTRNSNMSMAPGRGPNWRRVGGAVHAMGMTRALAGGRSANPTASLHVPLAAAAPKEEPNAMLRALSTRAGALRRFKAKFVDGANRISTALAISPSTTWYHTHWFYWAVANAMFSCWLTPFLMAFEDDRCGGECGCQPCWVATLLNAASYVMLATFLLDFFFKAFVGFYDPVTGVLVTTQPQMLQHYARSWYFTLDVIGCIPWERIVGAIAASAGASPDVRLQLQWFALLSLTRVYRVFDLFTALDYKMVLSQGMLMILRNYTYVLYIAHWAACAFYLLARGEGMNPTTWVGRNPDDFLGVSIWGQYVMAMYYSVTVFTAMGDPELYPSTTAEQSLMIVYLMFNLFLAAYVVGTVTMMMVKSDERSKAFRDRMSNLNEYGQDNELPERLRKAMREHLEVHFDSAQTSDDTVLSIYPITMRRRALRHLYLSPLKGCYLFRGCKQRFLDAILAVAHVELFLPGVEILAEGDNVVELMVVVAGQVEAAQGPRLGSNASSAVSDGFSFAYASTNDGRDPSGRSADGREASARSADDPSGHSGLTSFSRDSGSVHDPKASNDGTGQPAGKFAIGAKSRAVCVKRGCSDPLAEIAFFTDGSSYESVIGTTAVRILSVPRSAWDLLTQQFPQQVRVVLENLRRSVEAAVEENLKDAASRSQLTAEQLHVALSLVKASYVEVADPVALASTRDALTAPQMEMLTRLDDVRTVASAHVRKCDEMRTFELLNTAAMGDVESLRTMLGQGISPNTADYDGRTCLMLACAKGHEAVVKLFLDCGADKDRLDAFGNSALSEAVKSQHDKCIDVMLAYGATLGSGGLTVAAEMCQAVYNGELVKLRRMLRAGAPPDACDYDRRSALHIAGAEGNLEAVKLLIEQGGADPEFQDRWGNTALDEARRVGAAPVVAYLERQQEGARSGGGGAASADKGRVHAARSFLSWCSLGDDGAIWEGGGWAAGEKAGCAFAGLLVAAARGHEKCVSALLAAMPPHLLAREGHVAMLEAARVGHIDSVAAFRAAGVRLPAEPPRLLEGLRMELRAAALAGQGTVVAALVGAGVPARGPLPPPAALEGTALHLAVGHTHPRTVRYLVEVGGAITDVHAADGSGRTPMQLAETALAQAPSSSRAKRVVEYLQWAAALAAGGASQAALLAAASGKWGPIELTVAAHEALTKPAVEPAEAPKPPKLDASASTRERLLLSPRPLVSPAASDEPPATHPAISSPFAKLSAGNVQRRATSTDLTASLDARAGSLPPPGDAAGALPSGSGLPVVDEWANLPGTPRGSVRGGQGPSTSLMGAVSAALSAVALNEPPGSPIAMGGQPSPAPFSPGVPPGSAISLGSPRLILPPSSLLPVGAGIAANPLSPVPGASASGAPPGSPSLARGGSSRAAARLFGAGASTPTPARLDTSGHGECLPSPAVSTSAVQLLSNVTPRASRWSAMVGEDEITRYVDSFTRGSHGLSNSGGLGAAEAAAAVAGAPSVPPQQRRVSMLQSGVGGSSARLRISSPVGAGGASGAAVSSPSTLQGVRLADMGQQVAAAEGGGGEALSPVQSRGPSGAV